MPLLLRDCAILGNLSITFVASSSQCCDAGMMYDEAGLMRGDTSRHLQHKVTASPIFYKVTPAQGRSRSCRLVSTWR